jgi:hypothetical protein
MPAAIASRAGSERSSLRSRLACELGTPDLEGYAFRQGVAGPCTCAHVSSGMAAHGARLVKRKKSGLSARVFGSREGVKPSCLWRWKRSGGEHVASREAKPRPAITFAPVHVTKPAPAITVTAEFVQAEVLLGREPRVRVFPSADVITRLRRNPRSRGGGTKGRSAGPTTARRIPCPARWSRSAESSASVRGTRRRVAPQRNCFRCSEARWMDGRPRTSIPLCGVWSKVKPSASARAAYADSTEPR